MAGETAIGGRPAEHWGGSMARVCGSVPCGIQQIFSRWIARSYGPPVDSGGPSQGRRWRAWVPRNRLAGWSVLVCRGNSSRRS